MIHPADFARMSPEDRMIAAYRGDIDSGTHWMITRVAELTGLDPEALEHHVEIERGWESHDRGYLHEIIVSARILLAPEATIPT
jgi:hypothetical protein